MIHKSTGIVKYDPRIERGTFQKYWVILQCDREIVRYYQHIFYKLYWKKLQTAMWGAHCSIVRGEKPPTLGGLEAWKRFDGRMIEFSYMYEPGFRTNGQHVWLRAWSPKFEEIRESLGLPKEPKVPFHLSIGSIPQ